jgi:hypothetical protein
MRARSSSSETKASRSEKEHCLSAEGGQFSSRAVRASRERLSKSSVGELGRIPEVRSTGPGFAEPIVFVRDEDLRIVEVGADALAETFLQPSESRFAHSRAHSGHDEGAEARTETIFVDSDQEARFEIYQPLLLSH